MTTADEHPETRTWLRIGAGCALLVGLAFIQSPGLMVADTKFDLVADPLAFLERALHLWDPHGAFGQLQNQAYGYLWPMGPFFVLGWLFDLPGWVVQRLWMAVVMCVAFVGTARVSRAMGVRSDLACLVAGFAFATSPRILSTLGPISIEAWPSAVAPWVLLALVKGSTTGTSPRRMALLAGLAVAMVGGVNAAATFAVIPLGVVWLLTRTPGARRRSLMFWWPVFTVIGTLWWLVPLFVMGAYSPPFLDYIETASITTFPTTPFDALRGSSAWVPYIESSWQGGHETVTRPYLALNSGVVLMLGVVGMLWSRNPHRLFLVLSLALGLFMVTMGHVGSVQGWFAESLHTSLDGVLAPLRNVHKFDPVIRLPMVLGLAWLVEAAVRERQMASLDLGGRQLSWPTHLPVTALAAVAVVGAALPLVTARVAPADGTLGTPPYWSQTVEWLDDNAADSVALLAPGSGFADYLWGAPRDEPAQYLDADRWAVRNAIPLAPGGNIRMLDAFERRLTQGHGSEGLADYLRRAGVGHVVVRNDLAPSGDVAPPALLHQALRDSTGLELVRSYGPGVGGDAHLDTEQGRLLVEGGWQSVYPAVEIYEVESSSGRAVGATELPVVVGGPEDLLDLADAGVLGSAPTQLAVDVDEDAGAPEGLVLTDGLLDRERFFGRINDGYSSVLGPGATRRSGNPVLDYVVGDHDARWRTSARLDGAARLSASSSASDSNAFGGAAPGDLPFAAVDSDPTSTWTSDFSQEGGAWWQIDLESKQYVGSVTLRLGDDGDERKTVRVVTEQGRSGPVELLRGRAVEIPVEAATTWVRVVDDSRTGGRLSLADVEIPGVSVTRTLVLPQYPAAWGSPDAILLRGLLDRRTGCAEVDGDVRCLESHTRSSEEPDGFLRSITLPTAMQAQPVLTALPRAGDDLEALIQRDQPVNAHGSSTAVPDPRASGLAAVDGDVGTAWTPRLDDLRPTLSLNWLGRHRIDGVTVAVDPDTPARRPTKVEVTWPKGSRTVDLDEDGRGSFEAIRTDRLTIRVLDATNAAAIDHAGVGSRLPIGIGEVSLRGLPLLPLNLPTREERYACGSGPTLHVNGEQTRSRLVAAPADLFAMEQAEVEVCATEDTLRLPAGENGIAVAASGTTTPVSLLLDNVHGGPVPSQAGPITASETDASSMTVHPTPDAGVVVVHQNHNHGWDAKQGGENLEPVVIDGWQQGWRTTGSAEPVQATFTPDRTYRSGLLVGALALLGLLGLLLVPGRRWPGSEIPSLEAGRVSGAVAAVGAVLVGGVLGGWPGCACAVVGIGLGHLVRRSGEAGVWLLGALLFVGSGAYFIRPWGDPSGWAGEWAWPHYLVLVVLSSGLVVAAGDWRPRFRRRMKGSSTAR